MLHADLPKRPIKQFNLVQQSRKNILRDYCANIYTEPEVHTLIQSGSLFNTKKCVKLYDTNGGTYYNEVKPFLTEHSNSYAHKMFLRQILQIFYSIRLFLIIAQLIKGCGNFVFGFFVILVA